MKSTLVLLACFIGIALGAPRNDLQTPDYKVVNTFESDGEKFEERAYGVDMWVCTKQIITDITSDNGMFQKLFDYITGSNDRQEKIEMTSPVSTMRQKSTKGEIHEKCFYLYEKNPPKPTNEDVYIVKREAAMNVYTRTVMKRMSEKDWLNESASMDKLVASQKLKIKENVWYTAGYSDPFSTVQKNEAWKIKA